MKIALLGYGRMGKTIEELAINRGHEICFKTSTAINEDALKEADVAIDFSIPNAAFTNITTCFKLNIPVVSGTTGWLDNYDNALEVCHNNDGSFIYASNFSIGVNLFFKLNKTLAKLMANQQDYKVALKEIHHTKKLDAPSGTAITLAEHIIETTEHTSWHLKNEEGKDKTNSLGITAERTPDVPGTHTISYTSAIDTIDITHTAHTREGFALGAIIAAEWLKDKKGVFTMNDVLDSII
jgi:4-hydroxy-tetrahydrodipicolinate reductase